MASKKWMSDRKHFMAHLLPAEAERLRRAMSLDGLDFPEFVKRMAAKRLAERKPESGGGVRRILTKVDAAVFVEAVTVQIQALETTIAAIDDPTAKAPLRKRKGQLLDALAIAQDTIAEIEWREKRAASGEYQPRDRQTSTSKPSADAQSSN